MRSLSGKVALVTGGGGAIGRAISMRLAADGAEVHVLGRNAARLGAVVSEIREHGGEALCGAIDITRAHEFSEYVAGLATVDILVSNAGGSSRDQNAPFWRQSVEVIDDVLNVNLRSSILCAAAASRTMVRDGTGGRIILIGSTVGAGGKANFSDYAAAKAGLVGFTRSAAIELGPHGVCVNCVSPGIVPRGALTQRELETVHRKGVLPREGKPEDVAELVAFLASERAGFITGQEIIIDGGRSLGLRGDS